MAYGNRSYGGGNGYVAVTTPGTITLPLIDGGVIYAPTKSTTVTKTLPLIDGGSILAPTLIRTKTFSLPLISGGAIYGPTSVIVNGAVNLPLITGGSVYGPIVGLKSIFLSLIDGGTVYGPTTGQQTAQEILLPLISAGNIYALNASIPLLEMILGDSPAAMWKMDETSGTTFADSSGNGHDLTIVGSPALGTSYVMASGQGDLVWDPELGGGDYAYITYASGGSWPWPNLSDYGFLCWFCGTSVNGATHAYEVLINYQSDEMLEISVIDNEPGTETGVLRVSYAGEVVTNTIAQQGGVNLLDGLPHMIWVENRSEAITLFVDMVPGETAISEGTSTLWGTPTLYIGTNETADPDHTLNNPMGYVGIWKYTLPDIEHLQAYLEASQGAIVELAFLGNGSVDLDRDKLIINRHLEGQMTGNSSFSEDPQFVDIERSQVWWNQNYTYRRNIAIEATPTGLNEDHPITTYLSKKLVTQGKVRQDGADIEVLRLASYVPERWEVLNASVEVRDLDIKVVWANGYDIPANETVLGLYYIHYGNHSLTGAPDDFETPYIENLWPISITWDNENINYTRPSEHWVANVATEYQAKATFQFYGERVRICANTGLDWGIAEVQIDNGPWEQADLFSNPAEAGAVVYTRDDLSKAIHTVRYRLSGERNPSATDTKINLTKIEYAKWGVGEDMGEEADETLMWSSTLGGTIGG